MAVTSQNGYTANDRSRVSSRLVPHTTRYLTVVNGAPGDLLLAWAAWFDKFVEDIDAARGALDDWGYAERPIRGSTTELSNHASGTAIDLNATQHPLGKRGTFTAQQVALIHKELRRYGGCIRWGGDYQNRADEMHFEIVASRAKCALYLAKIRLTTKEQDMSLSPQTQTAIAKEAAAETVKLLLGTELGGMTDANAKKNGGRRRLGQVLSNLHNLAMASVTEGRAQSGQTLDAIKEIDR